MTLPDQMIDRWKNRTDQAAGEDRIYWHMLVGEHPEAVALAREAQQRLAGFPGLHMTPLRWLHMTAMIAGSGDQITSDQVKEMASAASRLLSRTSPISIRLGEIRYHPEAIMLAATPPDALVAVLEAVRSATHEITGVHGRPGNRSPWTPHITLCYSIAQQPAEPIIAALGKELPGREIRISTVSLVVQHGPERDWDWRPVASASFGTTA